MFMRSRFGHSVVVCGALLFVCLCSASFAQTGLTRDRVTTAIDPNRTITIQGSIAPLVRMSTDGGRLQPDRNLGQMMLMLSPTKEQNAALEKLVKELHTPSSPQFHRWLKPEEVGARFGVSERDAAHVKQWLESQGFKIHSVSNSRRFIAFSGTVAQVEGAFRTEMHEYNYKSASFIANAKEIQIPAAIAPVVRGVVRLSSTPALPNAKIVGTGQYDASKQQITFTNGEHAITPADFATIYNLNPLYNAGINGAGQSIGIVARSEIRTRDIAEFMAMFGIPWQGLYHVINGDNPGTVPGSDVEATLDLSWALALAPGSIPYIVISQSNFADGVDISAAYIVDNNLAPVMSTSFGLCEQNLGPVGNEFYYWLWAQAAAQGITSIVASGDNGGAGCDNPSSGMFAQHGLAVNGLASSPFNVAVGGTQFDDTDDPSTYWSEFSDPVTKASALSYIPEKVWNESSIDAFEVSLMAGSGGVSTLWSKPDWQIGAGVPSDGMRDLPDISFTAAGHDGYVLCYGGSCANGQIYIVGGTSASAPAFAAIMALVNQQTGSPQGNPNYVLYQLAAQQPEIFHDVTAGDNKVPDENGEFTVGYSAAPGYDLATGLGSADVTALVTNWANVEYNGTTIDLTGPAEGLTFVHGTGVPVTATVTAASGETPTGNVAFFTESLNWNGTPQGVGVGALDNAGTINIPLTAIPGGTHSLMARYAGDAKFSASTSNTVSVTVTPEPSATQFLASVGGSVITSAQAKYGMPVVMSVLVQGSSGVGYPTGEVMINEGGSSIGSRLLNFGEHEGTEQGASTVFGVYGFDVGTHLLTATYAGDASFEASTSPEFTLVITKSDVTPSFSLQGPALATVPVRIFGQMSLTSGAVLPISGTVAFTGRSGGDSIDLGAATLDPTSGTFAGSITFPTNGTWLLTVAYSGDNNVNPAQTAQQVIVDGTEPTTIRLTTSASTAAVGTNLTFTAQVNSEVLLRVPSGKVTFSDGPTVLGTADLDNAGLASFATANLGGGDHSVTATYGGDDLFRSSSTSVNLTISDYSVQAVTSAVTIKLGQTGTASIAVTPLGGFNQSLTFSCSGLPSGAQCTFSPAVLTPNGRDVATETMSISTTTTSAALSLSRFGIGWFATATFGVVGIMFVVPIGRRNRRRTLATLAGLVLALALWGCGGGSKTTVQPPPPNPMLGTYNVTVSTSATGVPTRTASLTVTIAE